MRHVYTIILYLYAQDTKYARIGTDMDEHQNFIMDFLVLQVDFMRRLPWFFSMQKRRAFWRMSGPFSLILSNPSGPYKEAQRQRSILQER